MRIYWNIGTPGWRLASQLGCPIKVRIDVFRDEEAGVYFATCEKIGLAVEGDSLDTLVQEIHAAVPELINSCFSLPREPKTDIRLHDDLVAA